MMNVYRLLIVVFSLAFVAPALRWFYLNHFLAFIRRMFKAMIKLKRKLAARKSKFQQEIENIASQYGVSSSSSDLQV